MVICASFAHTMACGEAYISEWLNREGDLDLTTTGDDQNVGKDECFVADTAIESKRHVGRKARMQRSEVEGLREFAAADAALQQLT